jgi:hypothetical protein
MRADGIATTPMLRAAIETDAATLRDIANTEMMFPVEKGESLEIFQLHGDTITSLLRIPRTAAALPALRGRGTQLHSDGQGVTLVASAPISGYRAAVAGGIVLSAPVDLTSIRRALDDHSVRASLTGLGGDLVLVPQRPLDGGNSVELAVPSSAQWSAHGAALVATPKRATGLAWALPTQALSGALSALLLIGFFVSLGRRARP